MLSAILGAATGGGGSLPGMSASSSASSRTGNITRGPFQAGSVYVGTQLPKWALPVALGIGVLFTVLYVRKHW